MLPVLTEVIHPLRPVFFLQEMEKKAGIIDRIADVLNNPDCPGHVTRKIKQLLRQGVYQVAAAQFDAIEFKI